MFRSWYEDSNVVEFNSDSSKSWSGKIIGVAEYDNNPSNDPIVVKLESGSGRDWFVGYNRATGPNADNVQGDDLVTIYRVTDGNGFGYSTSSLKDMLRAGQSTTITDWRGSGSNLIIEVSEINTRSSPGYARVDITFGGTPPGPGPGSGSSFFGLALSVAILSTLLLCGCLYMSCCKRKSSSGKRSSQFDDILYYGKSFTDKSATNLSYVGSAIYSTLQRNHLCHHGKMWNVTSGRVIGQVHYTPRDVWDKSSDPGEGHDDWFPEKMAEIIGRTEAWWYVEKMISISFMC